MINDVTGQINALTNLADHVMHAKSESVQRTCKRDAVGLSVVASCSLDVTNVQ